MEENSSGSSKTTGIIIIIVVVLVILAGGWYFGMYRPEQEAREKARQEQIAKERARKKREEQAKQKKARYDQLIVDGDESFQQEYWESAKSSYSEALGLFSNEQYPQDQLTIINQKLDSIAQLDAEPVPGTVQTISAATGRFYVVVSSSIDGDLAMDYAQKMAAEGNSPRLIQPFGKDKFYRVALGDYDSWDSAVSASSTFSTTDGSPVWVLKY